MSINGSFNMTMIKSGVSYIKNNSNGFLHNLNTDQYLTAPNLAHDRFSKLLLNVSTKPIQVAAFSLIKELADDNGVYYIDGFGRHHHDQYRGYGLTVLCESFKAMAEAGVKKVKAEVEGSNGPSFKSIREAARQTGWTYHEPPKLDRVQQVSDPVTGEIKNYEYYGCLITMND